MTSLDAALICAARSHNEALVWTYASTWGNITLTNTSCSLTRNELYSYIEAYFCKLYIGKIVVTWLTTIIMCSLAGFGIVSESVGLVALMREPSFKVDCRRMFGESED